MTTQALADGPRVQVQLLDGFAVTVDQREVTLPVGTQRLVAFLSTRTRPMLRGYVAGTLWYDTTDRQASANLRSSLWRAHELGSALIHAGRTHLCLHPQVRVDAHEAALLAKQIVEGDDVIQSASTSLLKSLLLPDWYDDWVTIERERLRQLCLGALERFSAKLLERGQIVLAIDAALAAVAAEPLRETAHRCLVIAHLRAGNRAEALRQYQQYCALLKESLGLQPSAAMTTLISGVVDPCRACVASPELNR